MAKAMNWIDELQAFYRRQTTYPLSSFAQALWVYLFYRASEVGGDMVRLSDMFLQGALRIGAARLQTARQELVDGKYLLHEDLNGNKPDGYTLIFSVDRQGDGA